MAPRPYSDSDFYFVAFLIHYTCTRNSQTHCVYTAKQNEALKPTDSSAIVLFDLGTRGNVFQVVGKVDISSQCIDAV